MSASTTTCPSCGHESERCYRCDDCGKDLVDVDEEERSGSPIALTDGGQSIRGTVQLESVTLVFQHWCDWCDAEDVELSHKIEVERMDITARFCSLQCAARWGCAADQDRIEVRSIETETDHSDADVMTDGGRDVDGGHPQTRVSEAVKQLSLALDDLDDDGVQDLLLEALSYAETGLVCLDAPQPHAHGRERSAGEIVGARGLGEIVDGDGELRTDGGEPLEEVPVCPDCGHWLEACACDELFAAPEPWEVQR